VHTGVLTSEEGDGTTIDSLLEKVASTSLLSAKGRFWGTTRYEVLGELGRGAFGVVYEAIDHHAGGKVALKVLASPDPDRRERLKHEFRALSTVRHPNLVRLSELESSGELTFVAMELVEGVPFDEHVRGDETRLRAALRQLAAGIDALHRRGKLHRDVKPSNVLVERATRRVVLLDFGLVTELSPEGSRDFAGTPRFMSPEQLEERPLTAAADWYAVGVMLYQALTGTAPYSRIADRLSPGFVLRRPRELRPDAPADLEELCVALLDADPAARPTGEAILTALGAHSDEQPKAEPALLIGRERELTALVGALESAAHKRRTMALVLGESGIGKTALLERFVDEARRLHPDAVILEGRSCERESVALKALDPIFDELARALRRMPERDVDVLVPRDVHALCQLCPALRRVEAIRRQLRGNRAIDALTVARRGAFALRELLGRLADRVPVVVCIDDLQWGDAASAELLAELVRAPDPPALCIVGAARSEDRATSAFLTRLGELLRSPGLDDFTIDEISLAPLSDEDTRALALRLAGPGASEHRIDKAVADAQGRPLFVNEFLLHDGAVDDLNGAIRARIARLPAPARRLLDVVAIVERPVAEPIAAAAAGLTAFREPLAHLVEQRLARVSDVKGERLLEAYHDRIRAVVAADVADLAARAALHRAIAETLIEAGNAAPLEIALHLRDAGDPDRACRYAIEAARAAMRALACEHAARLYRLAFDLRSDERAACALEHADALRGAGRSKEAATIYLEVARASDDPRTANELFRRAARELLFAGHVDEGLAIAREMLAAVGVSVPESTVGRVARLAALRLRLSLRGLEPAKQPAPPEALVPAATLSSVTLAVLFVDPILGMTLHTDHLLRALAAGDRDQAAIALAIEAIVNSTRGRRGAARSTAVLTRARALVSDAPSDMEATGHVLFASAMAALFEGRFRDAFDAFERAEKELVARGLALDGVRVLARVFRLSCLFWRGRARDVSERLPGLLRDAERQQNSFAVVWCALLEAWVVASAGDVGRGLAILAAAKGRIGAWAASVVRFWHGVTELALLTMNGDFDAAAERSAFLSSALRTNAIGQLERIGYQWFRGRLALSRAKHAPERRREHLAEAVRATRALEREGSWCVGLARTNRAAIAACAGDEPRAIELLAEAEVALEATDLEATLATVRFLRGELLGTEAGAEMARAARTWLEGQHLGPKAVAMLATAGWPEAPATAGPSEPPRRRRDATHSSRGSRRARGARA
jgi:predicted Ser/Thr protein kinase